MGICCFSLLTLVLSAGVLPAQEPLSESILKLKASSDTDLIHLSEDFKLTLQVEVSKAWHINSTRPLEDFLIPTRVTFEDPETIDLLKVVFPKPERISFPYLEAPVEVHSGTFRIEASVRMKGQPEPGIQVIRGHLEYQACNEEACLPPARARFTVPVMLAGSR